MGFVFNKDYNDLGQVAEYMPAFLAVYDEVNRGSFAYNDDFKGRIPAIEGPDEGRAIYMLQVLRRQRLLDAHVAELLANGYEPVTQLDKVTPFADVFIYPTRQMGGEQAAFTDARLVPRDGVPYGVLRKGKRTRGTLIMDRAVIARRERVA